ncbi:non-ribosomal peptide synthetase [Bacillus wiedmannii]|uniref:non-ribosomal peptide synthetase n=1 Tax=Bacillus wiedmannii TaxID=1890302 RepID=UPI000BF23DBC|nr:non-ribosomal peptide synthetase [Bacillus wiedmannii]PEL52431.1 hypothetical protein CN622_29680 [Bacillus wiedmannii]PEQ00755.1 hypothetical protein CN587_27840 [Bacillus wiedmannii]
MKNVPIYKTHSTFVDLLENRAKLHPDRIAYRYLNANGDEEDIITYAQLHQRACAIASVLQERLSRGERVILLYPQGIEFLAGFFGCLYAGMIAVTVYPPKPNRTLLRLNSIIEDCDASLALTNSKIHTQISNSKYGQALNLPNWYVTDEIENYASYYQKPNISEEDIAFLQYTSGSTSQPKGVAVSHKNLLVNEEMIKVAYNHSENTDYVCWLPLFHDMGLIGNVLQTIYTGSTCVLMSPSTFIHKPIIWLKAISKYNAHTSGGPNFAYSWCIQNIKLEECEGLDLSHWRVAFNGAEPIQYETQKNFSEMFKAYGFDSKAFCSCYGLAEATLFVTGGFHNNTEREVHVVKEALRRNIIETKAIADSETQTIVGCGVSGLGQVIKIVDPDTCECLLPNHVGEIWIRGAHIANGYWKKKEATQETFHARVKPMMQNTYLRTGDLGFIRNGQLYVTGRLKDLIIIRGRNYYPQDIEITAEQSSVGLRHNSNAAFTVKVNDEQRLVIVQEVERSYRKKPLYNIVERIRKAVESKYELQVHSIVLITPGSIPKTTSGKIQRKACSLAYLSGSLKKIEEWHYSNAGHVDGESQMDLETWICNNFSKALGINITQLDLNYPLSHYGLDSMTIVNIVHSIEKRVGINIPMARFFENISLRSIIDEILEQSTSLVNQKDLNVSSKMIRDNCHHLSHGQRSMYFMYRLAPNSSAYHISKALRICGPIDIPKLSDAFQTIINSHAILRTTYGLQDGEPVQFVKDKIDFRLMVEDVSLYSDGMLKGKLEELMVVPFDLEKGPVFRCHLLSKSNNEHILFFCFHHIAVDFWSLGLFIKQLVQLYQSENVSLTTEATYSEFVTWQSTILKESSGKDMYKYWEKQLSGDLQVVELPLDKERPIVQTYKGAVHTVKLSNPYIIKEIKKNGRQHGVTMYMYLLSVFNILINKYTGLRDFTIGTPTLGRNKAEFSDVMGYFVNPVVLRSRIRNNLTFIEFLKDVRDTVLGAFNNQVFPFDLLVEKLKPTRELGYSPLFQIMFAMQKSNFEDGDDLTALACDLPGESVNVGGMNFENYPLSQKIAQYDLSHTVAEVGGELIFSFEYNSDLFKKETINRMMKHYINILEQIIENPNKRLDEINILLPEEIQVIEKSNATQCINWRNQPINSLSVIELFREQVKLQPQNHAVIYVEGDMEKVITYEELDRLSNSLASRLEKLGIKPEGYVGTYLDKSIDLVVSIIAILKVGGVYVPIDPKYPLNRVSNILQQTQLEIVLTNKDKYQDISKFSIPKISCLEYTNDKEDIQSSIGLKVNNINPDNASCIIFTSGSTGDPKGVVMNYEGLLNLVLSFIDSYKSNCNDRILPITAVSAASLVGEILPALCSGSSLVLLNELEALDQERVLSVIEKQKVSIISSVPSLISKIGTKISKLPSLRLILSGGEELSLKDIKSIQGQATIVNGYGLTETTVCSTYTPIKKDCSLSLKGLIGAPVLNHHVYILDENFNIVPIGVTGEIYIGGLGVTRGYLNDSRKTALKYLPNPFKCGNRMFKTGDLGRRLMNGEIEYMGRIDRQIKIRGFRIEAGEVEQAIMLYPYIKECVVMGEKDSVGEDILVAYLVFQNGYSPDINKIIQHLREKTPSHMIPSRFVKLDSIPYLTNGKVDTRTLLLKKQLGVRLQNSEFVPPQSALERTILRIWAEVLNVEQIGIQDNFFDLGGHSLAVMQVQSKLRESLQREIPIVELFRYSSVQSLSEYLNDKGEDLNISTEKINYLAEKRKAALLRRVRPKI